MVLDARQRTGHQESDGVVVRSKSHAPSAPFDVACRDRSLEGDHDADVSRELDLQQT